MRTPELDNVGQADAMEVWLCTRLYRALVRIDDERGPGGVAEAFDWAQIAINERAEEIRDAEFCTVDVWGRRIRALTGASQATIETASKLVLRLSRLSVALDAIESYALSQGIRLTRRVAR